MKAIGFTKYLPIDNPQSLFDFNTAIPTPKAHDLLVKVNAISVNPVDVGVRKSGHSERKTPKVIGWDAVGKVIKLGNKASLFKVGDKVFYAGSFKRPGSDSEYQVVDERIVGHAPHKIEDYKSAAMPLTSLTAWEALFEKLEINPKDHEKNSKKIF
jgi:NADPH:quinone reductase-like Zn-dependent oxidoreductase